MGRNNLKTRKNVRKPVIYEPVRLFTLFNFTDLLIYVVFHLSMLLTVGAEKLGVEARHTTRLDMTGCTSDPSLIGIQQPPHYVDDSRVHYNQELKVATTRMATLT